mmetsp:Transcript_21435/g.30712  ORF Transcript_21435/g.30712 Transcript_21435/m.30712 type:complete len:85 (-) Transcript_21435:490-744(-)
MCIIKVFGRYRYGGDDLFIRPRLNESSCSNDAIFVNNLNPTNYSKDWREDPEKDPFSNINRLKLIYHMLQAPKTQGLLNKRMHL